VYVSEANYDWGQGLRELARWEREQGLSTLDVWYFGTDPLMKRLPLHEVPLHVLPVTKPEDVTAQLRSRYLAVSTTLLYGAATNTTSHQRAAAFLRTHRPVARTQTFLIFDFGREATTGPLRTAQRTAERQTTRP
jgi:hypothetical protein